VRRTTRASTTRIFTAILLCLATEAPAVEAGGYYKSFFVAENLPEAVHRAVGLEQSWVGSVSQRVRLNASQGFTDWMSIELSYDLVARVQDPALFEAKPLVGFVNASAYRAADLDVLLYPRTWDDVGSIALLQNLDRLAVTMSASWFDVYIGRQAIAWGSARAINATDVLAPFLYTDLDTEDRIGIDAVRLRAPLGALGELDVGYVAGSDFEFDESAVFLRARTYAAKTDLTGLVTAFREHLMIGADVARAIGEAGSWLEAAYVLAGAAGGGRDADFDYLRVSTGLDYSFGKLYGFVEYHFNQAGATDPGSYTDVLLTPAYTDGAVYLLGEHYLIPGASYQLTPLATLSASLLVNMNDPSILIATSLEHNFREDVYLEFGAYIGVGDAPALMPVDLPPDLRVPGFRFDSEFGAYPDTYFASFRVYF
jgi:hypothetical protein